MTRQLAEAVVLLGIAAGLVLLGRWGRGHAELLSPAYADTADRERKMRSVRRGAVACYGAALVLAMAAVLALW